MTLTKVLLATFLGCAGTALLILSVQAVLTGLHVIEFDVPHWSAMVFAGLAAWSVAVLWGVELWKALRT